MYKVLALFGPSGAGKDTIQKWYASHADIHEIVSATTRPPREYEQDTVDYYFLTEEEFTDKVLDGSMLEVTSFRGWYYGTLCPWKKRFVFESGRILLSGRTTFRMSKYECGKF